MLRVQKLSNETFVGELNKEFHLKNGDTDQQATEKAMNKIISVRALRNKVSKH